MTRSDEDGRVDQIVFGKGPQGVDVLGSSFGSQSGSEFWRSRLISSVRLEFYQDFPVPLSSLSYFVFDDTAAVLRRTGEGQTNGRNYSYALVGSADVLTPRRALNFDGWAQWADNHQEVGRPRGFSAAELPAPHAGDARLPDHLVPRLVEMVAALLRDPRETLTVVGAEEGSELPLLAGVLDVLEPLYANSDVRRRWSFSTHEKEITFDNRKLADIVFLPGVKPGVTGLSKSLVHFGPYPESQDWRTRAATRLVDRYRRDGQGAVGGEFRLPDKALSRRLDERITVLHQRTDGSIPHQPPVREPVTEIIPRQGAKPAALDPGWDDPVVPPSRLDLVANLIACTDPAEVTGFIGRLTDLGPDAPAEERRQLRTRLLDNDFTDSRIDQLASASHQPRLYRLVVQLSFGRYLEDLKLADGATLSAAADLVSRHNASPGLVHAVLDLALSNDKFDLVSPAFGMRLARERGHMVPEPQWSELFCPDPERHQPAPPAPVTYVPLVAQPVAGKPWDQVTIMAGVIVLSFLLGLVVGLVNSV